MGTLTANQDRLPGYCEHKLPTSCRLTAIPNCCACADERAHSASYSTYIDGIGFVPRGNRWQRYCWFCKEFWAERVRVSGLRPGQTRVPEIPEQAQFLERWYEFHRGYRLVKRADGSEERVAVLGEELKDVDPGCLPRTVEEMRAGARAREEVQRVERDVAVEGEETGPSLDDTLEGMFQAASLEENSAGQEQQQQQTVAELPAEPVPLRSGNIHAQAMVPTSSRSREYQARRVAALRRELHRMRNGIERVISGLRDLGENVPDHSDATGRLHDLGRTLDTISGVPSHQGAQQAIDSVNTLASNTAASQTDRNLANFQSRVDEACRKVDEARLAREQAASELDLSETEFRTSQQRLQQLQREQRTAENYMRIFGTREEMAAAGESYESPIGGMFQRAYERFHVAEDVRREERTLRQVLEHEARGGAEDEVRRLVELEGRERDVWGVPAPARNTARSDAPALGASGRSHPTTLSRAQQISRYMDDGIALPPRGPQQRPAALRNMDEGSSLPPRGEEALLEQYYRMLREQEGPQIPSEDIADGAHTGEAFPRSMLNALLETRQREFRDRSATTIPDQWWEDEVQRDWLERDALHSHDALQADDQLRERMGLSSMDLSDPIETTASRILRDPMLIWETGLPTEWLQRRMAYIQTPHEVLFSEDGSADAGSPTFASHHNSYLRIEIVAQAFQMSAEVRRQAPGLTPPERLSMLYRLQAGHREERDVAILEHMWDSPESSTRMDAYMRIILGDTGTVDHARRYDDLRRQRAREGDHSRSELDANRQATQAFAVAAGRQAMQTGSQALLERMAERDDETRAAYRRLQDNGFTDPPAHTLRHRPTLYRQLTLNDYSRPSSHASESEDEEGDPEQGLDARDTGRPDPKTDEELTVQMECKICYTQMAEIACLPCGHLVMCRWCSDQHSPVMQQDRTRPRRAAGCPLCRKGVRNKVRVYRA